MSAAAKITADAAEGAPAPAAKSRKKLILIAVVVLLAGAGAGLWFTGILPHLLGLEHEKKAEESKPQPPVFVDLPEMVANLNANARRPSYVKLVAKLEVAKPEDAERVKAAMPRIVDLFQIYLREMRPEELRGSAGTHRLREELIARASIAAAPVKVRDVLFGELIVQ